MATICNKCGMRKITPNTPCACNVKKFNEDKFKTKKAPTPIKQVSDKKKERLASGGGEINFFRNIFKNKLKAKQNYCIICKKEVTEDEVNPACFPHILPKWKYPELRLLESNLQFLVCGIDHHSKLDEIIREYKKEIWLDKLKKLIMDGKKIDISNYLL